METNIKLNQDDGEPLKDLKLYRRLIGKLLYLTITQLDLSYVVNQLSQSWTLTQSTGPARLAFKRKGRNEKVEFSSFEKPTPGEERCCMELPLTFYFYF